MKSDSSQRLSISICVSNAINRTVRRMLSSFEKIKNTFPLRDLSVAQCSHSLPLIDSEGESHATVIYLNMSTAAAIENRKPAAGRGSGRKNSTKNSSTKNIARAYPRGLGVDFRKLAGLTLMGYIDHHGACFVN